MNPYNSMSLEHWVIGGFGNSRNLPSTTLPLDTLIPRAAPMTITTLPRSTIHPSVATSSYRHSSEAVLPSGLYRAVSKHRAPPGLV